MKLKELLSVPNNLEDIEINGIAYDLKEVKPGYIFVARKGMVYDSHKFIKEAIERGASFLIIEKNFQIDCPKIIVEDSRKILAKIADKFYNSPSKKLKMIGVTGTQGKTTSTMLLKSVYENAGYKVGLLGTIEYIIHDERIKAHHTTPESLDIQKFLNKLLEKSGNVCVMEVSSHGIALHRIDYIDFDFMCFTCMGRDHLDFHYSFEEYKNTKIKAFNNLKKEGLAILNKDDKYFDEFRENIKAKIISYGSKDADITGKIISATIDGIKICVKYRDGEGEIFSHLPGSYNFYNILLATACAITDGIDFNIIAEGVEKLKTVPGRFEKVGRVIIDYAHTPNALEALLKEVRKLAKGRIICIFGCGGDRDKGKRPIMGKIASEYCDHIILTTDNPRNEDPLEIVKEIANGIENASYEIILDRKDAIRNGIERSSSEDIVVVVGKGHEDYQIFGEIKMPWSDKNVVKEILYGAN